MKAKKLYSSVADASRQYELSLESARQRVSAIANQQMQLTQSAAAALAVIADSGLAEGILVGPEVGALLAERRNVEDRLRAELQEVESRIAAQGRALADIEQQVDTGAAKVAEALANNPKAVDLGALHKALVARRVALFDSHIAIQAECTRKLPAYGKNPFYSYLVKAGYGTGDYHQRGVLRRLDDWLAGLCNFSKNRQNEQMLHRMREESNKLVAEAESTLAGVEGQLQQVVTEVEALHQMPDIQHRKQKAAAALKTYKAQANELHERLHAFSQMRDPQYQQARKSILALVSSESEAKLAARCAQTASPSDDEALVRLTAARSKLKALQSSAKEAETALHEAEAAYERIKTLQRELRRYSNSSDYEFRNGLDLSAVLAGYMAGQLSERSALQEINKYRREVESSSSAGRSGYYTSSSSSSSSGYSSGGGWSSSSDSDSGYSSSSSFGGSDSSSSYSTSDSF